MQLLARTVVGVVAIVLRFGESEQVQRILKGSKPLAGG